MPGLINLSFSTERAQGHFLSPWSKSGAFYAKEPRCPPCEKTYCWCFFHPETGATNKQHTPRNTGHLRGARRAWPESRAYAAPRTCVAPAPQDEQRSPPRPSPWGPAPTTPPPQSCPGCEKRAVDSWTRAITAQTNDRVGRHGAVPLSQG
jgi:hypothetical protein